jgi:hypothetical protein
VNALVKVVAAMAKCTRWLFYWRKSLISWVLEAQGAPALACESSKVVQAGEPDSAWPPRQTILLTFPMLATTVTGVANADQ